MVRARPVLPEGHGEVLMVPAFDAWAGLMERNARAISSWSFDVAGIDARVLRKQARREAVADAVVFSSRLGVPVREPSPDPERIVLTGHQPLLYHPGVWVKNFLLQRIADETAAAGIDLVVDSDAVDAIEFVAPCIGPRMVRCHETLVEPERDAYYAAVPRPDAATIEHFCERGARMVGPLPAPAMARHFATYCECLRAAATNANEIAELMTMARRRYEAAAGTNYLELPVTRLAAMESYRIFVADILLAAKSFAEVYNSELAEYRSMSGTRSKAQPFPDLSIGSDRFETPFWALLDGRRHPVTARRESGDLVVMAGDRQALRVRAEPDAVIAALRQAPLIAPKAVALTLFARLFLGDLFIHGVGGARYETITDGVCRNYFKIDPPAFVVASMTMYLPLGAHQVTTDEVAHARRRLGRFEHNPDTLLGEAEFDNAEELMSARELAGRKARLLESIVGADADKKALGLEIRSVNRQLAELLAPVADRLRRELESLEGQLEASEVLTDRTYPFCLWSPEEVRDKVR